MKYIKMEARSINCLTVDKEREGSVVQISDAVDY